jgi:hypothetical protein
MGSEGLIPALQVGGVQEAITVPCPPAAEVVTVPMLAYTFLLSDDPEAATDVGLEWLQVSGKPGTDWSALSIAVASNVVDVPLFTRNEVIEDGLPAALTVICFIRQVSTETG